MRNKVDIALIICFLVVAVVSCISSLVQPDSEIAAIKLLQTLMLLGMANLMADNLGRGK